MSIKRPNEVKVFADNSVNGSYFPIRFGTNIPVTKGKYEEVANENFEQGLEALNNDLQMKDLNSVFYYQGSLLKYLFQQGVPEFSAYQDYPMGAVVQKDGEVWIATKEIKASLVDVKPDPCNPCKVEPVCQEPIYPSKEGGWCKFITSCEYDSKIKELESKDEALQKAIDALKGVETFAVVPNKETGVLELNLGLSDGSSIVIPMTKFGHIEQKEDGTIHVTNADGSTLTLPKYVAEKDLDQQKGFFFNTKSEKWEVDLADLVKDGSGLQVDKNGNISVKPVDIVDGDTLHVNAQSGKIEIDPEWYKRKVEKPIEDAKNQAIKDANKHTDDALNKLKEDGAKVYTNSPIIGDGTKDNKLGLNLGEDFIVGTDGKLLLNAVAPQSFDGNSISSAKYKLGFHTFTGSVNNQTRQGTIGLPKDFENVATEEDMANDWGSYTGTQNYDFNGYYIASGAEVNVFVMNNKTAWTISNDGGVNNDGSLKNPAQWTKWQRLDNVGGITDEMIKKMQEQVNALAGQVTSLQNTINGFVPLKDASGTITLGYIKP